MKRKIKSGLFAFACIMLLCSTNTVRAKDEQIKISKNEYAITLNGSNFFVGNNTPVSGEVGTKVFFTYTVDKVRMNNATQHGVTATLNLTDNIPYVYLNGGALYYGHSQFFEEGCTYLFRFERTEKGFEYECVRLKGNESKRISLTAFYGERDGAFPYYGIWVGAAPGDDVDVDLVHVRCYDENGNDLGIYPFQGNLDGYADEQLLDTHLVVDRSYNFKLDDHMNVLISNKTPVADADGVVYMEYEVKKLDKDGTLQSGLSINGQPEAWWPQQDDGGILRWGGGGSLTQEGAKYFICFQKKEDTIKGTIQRTLNGRTETFTYGALSGKYNPNHGYYSLWIGEGETVSCEIVNFKCYDSKGNDLGVQFNQGGIFTSYNGPIADYSSTVAVYYCKEKDSLIVLQDEQKAYMEKDGIKESALYKVLSGRLELHFEEGKEFYDYAYLKISDDEGNVYKRLKNVQVTFVTGKEKIVLKANAKNGFRIEEPEAPTKEGNVFKGWFLADGTEFDANKVVTNSLTVYAKWQDGDGNEYLEIDSSGITHLKAPVIAIGASVIIAIVFTLICIMILRKKGRDNYEN